MDLDIAEATQRLASVTSRRGLLTRVGQGLVGAALITVASTQRAAASSCTCVGQSKCSGLACGNTGNGANACCISYPPCAACGSGGVTSGTSCTAPGYFAGWYWYCCIRNGDLNELWKCQDCCSSGSDPCYTVRSQVGSC